MPWYISFSRLTTCAISATLAGIQLNWIRESEDRYRRSLTWKPTVATIFEHKMVAKKFGSSHVWYRYNVDGETYVGERFRSGGLHDEERLTNPTLLGSGTELVVYYNPVDPSECAIKLQQDREGEAWFAIQALLCLAIAYRAVRCETVLPNLFFRFLHINRRITERTGLKTHRPNSHGTYGFDGTQNVTTRPKLDANRTWSSSKKVKDGTRQL